MLSLLKYGLSVLAFGIVAYKVDLSDVWARMANQPLLYIAMAISFVLLQIIFGGLRWHAILDGLGAKPSAIESLRLFYISAFFNSCFWGGIGGDVLRVWLVHKGDVLGRTAISSVILDRVAALAGVALLVLTTSPIYLSRLGEIPTVYIPAWVALACLLGIAILAYLGRIPNAWLHLRFIRHLQSFGGAVHIVFFTPKKALPVLGFAVAAQIALGVAAYVMAVSLGLNVGFVDCVILIQPVVLVAALPISVGGWGVRETAMIAFLGTVGVPASAALALSVQLGLLSMLGSLPGLILWLLIRSKVGVPDGKSSTAGEPKRRS